MFQPNPTTVTVVPPARTINILPGEGEEVDADEVLGAQPQQQQQVQQQGGGMPSPVAPYPYPYPMPQMPPYGYPSPYPGQGPYGYPQMQPYPSLNTGGVPAIFANSQPPPGQLYTSGVPGAPPTFAVQTDSMAMNQFGGAQIKPKKSNITLRRRGVSFASGTGGGSSGGSGQEDSQQGGGGSVVVTVSKMG